MKKILPMIVALLLLLPVHTAQAAGPATVTLTYDDIAARVEKHNSSVRTARLALDEANTALRAAWKDYYEQKEQGEGPGREQIQKQDQNMETHSVKYAQTLGQQVNAARQAFIRAGKLQNNLGLQQYKLEQAEQALESAKTRLTHGLTTPAALTEAERELNSAQAEFSSLTHQLQTSLMEIKSCTGYNAEDTLLLSVMPQPDPAYPKAIDLEHDIEEAVSNSYAVKLLQIERAYTFGSNARRRLDIQIEQQQAAVRQAVEQKYYTLLEAQAQLALAAAELEQREQQLKTAETNFALGRISRLALDSQRTASSAKQVAHENAGLLLLGEIENYKSLLSGDG